MNIETRYLARHLLRAGPSAASSRAAPTAAGPAVGARPEAPRILALRRAVLCPVVQRARPAPGAA
jgi:hypothetical protein